MSLSLDKYRAKLVLKIIYAGNVKETGRFINVAIRSLKKRKINGYIITRFVDKIIRQLDLILNALPSPEPADKIISAKLQLQQIREEIYVPVS